MPAPSKRLRDYSFSDLLTTGKGIAFLLSNIAVVVIFIVVFNAVTSEDEPDYSDWQPHMNSVTCPDSYARAGQRIEYDEHEVLGTWDKIVNDKLSEAQLARQRVIEGNCGSRRQPTRSPQEIAAERDREERAREQAARDREAGFHCLSGWDGKFNNLEALIRRQLHNPDSMETVSTGIAPAMPNGKHRVEMVFRAENQYGAVVTATALGSAHSDTCIAELFSIDGQIITDAGCSHEIFGIIECE